MRRSLCLAAVVLASCCGLAAAGEPTPGSFEARLSGEQGLPVLRPRDFAGLAALEDPAEPRTPPSMVSALAMPVPTVTLAAPRHAPAVLDARRAQILLRSLTIPGWGQATLGRSTSATVFALLEAGIWGSYASFQIQDRLRTRSYERNARVTAGIDLSDRDEEFRRIVGSFLSSDEYNLLVVARDAANLYYDDPPRMNAYIDSLSLRGSDAWAWPDVDALLRYRAQRKDAQRAQQRANTVLAVAVANRLVSALHAARAAGHPQVEKPQGWRLEVAPDPRDWTAVRLGVRTRF